MIVTKSMYKIGERKYIEIDGKQVKIRWRYNRPMISQEGLKTIFEYKEGTRFIVRLTTSYGKEKFISC